MAGERSSYFNYNYYTPDEGRMYSVGDNMANEMEYVISFYHVAMCKDIYFKAYITTYNETFNSDWTPESVYGRSDPIYIFKQTQRVVTLGFEVLAESKGEAYENLGKVGALTQFLYPVYQNTPQAQTISQSPLVRLKMMNLGRSMVKAQEGEKNQIAQQPTPSDIYRNYQSTHSPSNGMLGVINNVTINHNIEGEEGVVLKGVNTILPKRISVNVSFNVIHEHTLGWDSQKVFGEGHDTFPYGVHLEEIELKDAVRFISPDSNDETFEEAFGQAAQDEVEGHFETLNALSDLDSPAPTYGSESEDGD